MKIACLSFTRLGEQLAQTLNNTLTDAVDLFFKDDYKQHLNRIYADYDAVIFISSTGIATRITAPFLKSKATDPAVVVVDDMGKFSISLVSGHLGGANELALKVAAALGAQPVITTASDNREFEAPDIFAKKHGLVIENLAAAKTVTAMMVDGKSLGFFSAVTPEINYPHITANDPACWIFVDIAEKIDCKVPACILRPQILTIGLGCRRGKTGTEIMKAITDVFASHSLSLKSIRTLATIELKKDEAGIHDAVKTLQCKLVIYPTEDLAPIQSQFNQSDFVTQTTGVGAVAEPCAVLGGNELIVEKTVLNGITVAVAIAMPKTLSKDSGNEQVANSKHGGEYNKTNRS